MRQQRGMARLIGAGAALALLAACVKEEAAPVDSRPRAKPEQRCYADLTAPDAVAVETVSDARQFTAESNDLRPDFRDHAGCGTS